MNTTKTLYGLFCFLLLANLGWGATIWVPDKFGTIQGAIDNSGPGDTIIVREDVYYETITFPTHQIVLKSHRGADVTIIDAKRKGPVVMFPPHCGLGHNTVLKGFTLRKGFILLGGGGIDCEGNSPAILNNIIEDNESRVGGGITCRSSQAVIKNNTVRRNTGVEGGGVLCIDSSPEIDNNIITDNYSTIGGGGLSFKGCTATAVNNTITGNRALWFGGGLFCTTSASNACDVTIINPILWSNVAAKGPGPEIAVDDSPSFPSTVTIRYSDVKGGESGIHLSGSTASYTWGPGNLYPPVNPEFVAVDPYFKSGDFHLTYPSPCRNTGDNAPWTGSDKDFEGDKRIYYGIADMGADEFAPHIYPPWLEVNSNCIIALEFVGEPNFSFKIGKGSGFSDPPNPTPYGDLYLQPPFAIYTLGPIPASGVYSLELPVPASWAPGDEIPIQALIDSELTNLAVIAVVNEDPPPPPDYRYDDGSSENLLGLTAGGDMCWLQRFDAIPGCETITSVEVMFGSAAFSGYGPGNGTPATVFVWDDPTNDGDPNDNVLLQSTATLIDYEDSDILCEITLDMPVVASGEFYVGCCLTHGSGQYVAPFDTDTPYLPGRAWYCGTDVPGTFDPGNLGGLPFPPVEWNYFWCLRAEYQ